MKYKYGNKKLIKYTPNVIVIKDYDYDGDEFCLEEVGYKLVNSIPFEAKDLKIKNNNLIVNGKLKVKLVGWDDMPSMSVGVDGSNISVNLQHIKEASKFVDKNAQRPALTGVMVNDKGTVCGTDSFKVYYINNGESDNQYILSMDFVEELINIKEESCTTSCELYFNETFVKAAIKGYVVYGRLINSAFPNVARIIPTDVNEKIDFTELNTLINIGKNVGKNVTIKFNEGNKVLFSSDENEYEDTYVSPIIKTCLNLYYLILTINVMGNNPLVKYEEELKPITFLNKEENKYVVIVPMRR